MGRAGWRRLLLAACWLSAGAPALAQHQTADLTPLSPAANLPFRISLRPYDFGSTELPTLHSYAAAEFDGKWLLISGRTNGLHAFDRFSPATNFPPQSQNRDVWVIDPIAKQSWRRSLTDAAAGLGDAEINSLSATNNQFFQQSEHLYISGGYGVNGADGAGTPTFGTFDTLSAIDAPGLMAWTMGGSGAAADHIRQIHHPAVKVTGGAMYPMGGLAHLVFGQDFDGAYTPQTNGVYTNQVRSFRIIDDGVNLEIEDVSASTPRDEYRRRDLNVFPTLSPGTSEPIEGLVALSGVFTPLNGAWTVPVEIDSAGAPTMADPAAADTFKQGFNGYHSAKLGLYSSASGDMHEVLFGGISVQSLDEITGIMKQDNALPFVNDVTAVAIDAAGRFSQHHLGFLPIVNDVTGKRLRLGANAEFFAAEGIARFTNGVIDLDQISASTTVGYIFGGLAANGPHTRGVPGVASSASNLIFEVTVIPVSEPATGALALVFIVGTAVARRAGWKSLSGV